VDPPGVESRLEMRRVTPYDSLANSEYGPAQRHGGVGPWGPSPRVERETAQTSGQGVERERKWKGGRGSMRSGLWAWKQPSKHERVTAHPRRTLAPKMERRCTFGPKPGLAGAFTGAAVRVAKRSVRRRSAVGEIAWRHPRRVCWYEYAQTAVRIRRTESPRLPARRVVRAGSISP